MIRKLEQKDKENWTRLYNGYADFYKVPMNTGVLDTVWGWIHDESHDVKGLCFDLEGKNRWNSHITEQCLDQLRANILVF